jgi:hypothetical protein
VLAANQHPDHDTICDFRERLLAALSNLFARVLDVCREAGLAKLGNVAIDARGPGPSAVRAGRGTKVRANASKHKAGTPVHSAVPTGRAMSYGRMKKVRWL